MPAATYTAIRHRRQQRAAKLSALGFASYADYLNSAQWRTVRQRYFASDLPQDCMGEEWLRRFAEQAEVKRGRRIREAIEG